MKNLQSKKTVNCSTQRVFEALTVYIPRWWTEMFEGTAHLEGQRFTVRFGADVYKTMQVEILEPDRRVIWLVEDSVINVPGLKNQTEWVGTRIVWELASGKEKTGIDLTHEGLHPAIECYEICAAGWDQFLSSLVQFAETGTGLPFRLAEKQSA